MSMTVVVTRDVALRIRGFLGSTMLELAPGVYSAAHLSPTVRDRIWAVLNEWFGMEKGGSVVMLWEDKSLPGGQSVKALGLPPIDLVVLDGIVLSRKNLR